MAAAGTRRDEASVPLDKGLPLGDGQTVAAQASGPAATQDQE
jgi:hypothetical protein